VNDAAYGDLKELINDVGINQDSIPFHNFNAQKAIDSNLVFESDPQFKLLANAMFTPLDMTDHEEAFIGWNELPGDLPISNIGRLSQMKQEAWPQTDKLVGIEEDEARPIFGTGPTYQDVMKGFKADVEPEEADDEYGADGGDDYGDDYGEEGEEGEGDADYGDYGDYDDEEEEVWPPKDSIPHTPLPDRFFNGASSLRDSYNHNEIDAFMRLLSVRPTKQWEDESTHHHKLGVHRYEDMSQELDPAFHTLSEVERKHAEKITTKEWRSGSEVKFQLGDKRPITRDFRF
jgi:hypothetical protein